ncbi:MAG: helix-turn-helix domain-containing protein [Synechococcus sp.]
MRFPRLWPRRATSSSSSGLSPEANDPISLLQSAGDMLKERRQQRGLSLRELSREIRITTPVLEALERGWSDRLPEAAYLGTMLTQLERHLDLPAGSLQGAMASSNNNRRRSQTRRHQCFTLCSIDNLSTWQGSVVYATVMLGTLLVLNQQQRDLAQRHSQQLKPIPPTAEQLQLNNAQSIVNPPIPGLQPLNDAQRKPLQHWLPTAPDGTNGSVATVKTIGLLQLKLSRPSTISLTSAGGDRSNLSGSSGQLTLQLKGPVELQVKPPPQEGDAVLWNGIPQRAFQGQPGTYRLPQRAALSP